MPRALHTPSLERRDNEMSLNPLIPIGQNFMFGNLRSLAEQDASGMLEWMRDLKVNRWFVQDFSSMDKESASRFIQESWSNRESLHLAVDDGSGGYLGTISLKNIDCISRSAEYAIALRSAAHGTGVAQRATSCLLQLARDKMGLTEVYLNVLRDNSRARAFYEKVGFMLLVGPPAVASANQADKGIDLVWYEMRLIASDSTLLT